VTVPNSCTVYGDRLAFCGGCSCQCISLMDHTLNHILFVGVEVCGERLVELRLLLLEF
jgi:hypothetical protein